MWMAISMKSSKNKMSYVKTGSLSNINTLYSCWIYLHCNPGPSQVLLTLFPGAQTEPKFSCSVIVLYCAVWGYSYFEQMEGGVFWLWWLVHPDGWCQSDMEAQQHLKSLRGESQSRALLILTVDLTLFGHIRPTHLLPFISSHWLTVSIEHF